MNRRIADEPLLKAPGKNPRILLAAKASALAEENHISTEDLLRDTLKQISSDLFKSKVFAKLAERGIQHDFGPACAAFTAFGQVFQYVTFGGRNHYFGVSGSRDPVADFGKSVVDGLPIVWRIAPEADGNGGFFARLIQVTQPVFDLVTSKQYIEAFMKDELHDKKFVAAG